MNPLHWKLEHQLAWAVSILAGAAIGLIFGWLASPFSHAGQADAALFLAWLHYPTAWGPWAIGGAVAAGLAYYSGDLLTGAD